MRVVLLILSIIVFGSNSFAQDNWNWPEDPDKKSVAMEKQAYYKVSMGLENWGTALNELKWLYENNPSLNPSIYIDGVKVVENLLDQKLSEEREQRLKDSLLLMYDLRLEHFDADASTMDRKAYSAFKLYYKDPSKYPMLADLYAKAFEMNGSEISIFNITPYMTLAKYYNQVSPEEMTPEKVLDIHGTLSDILDQKLENGELSASRAKKEQDKIDAILSSMGDILSCDFIESKLVPKLEKNPNDLGTAKKIFSYSLKAKCSDQPYFTKAGDLLFKNEPSYKLAMALGNKYMAADENQKAIEYYETALEMADDNEEKYDAYFKQANSFSKLGNKPKARSRAYEALSIMPGSNEAYNLIGNLYFTSFERCMGGESKVKDRAVFIAAHEMYKKAGNEEQMQASKEQFPSVEEIFNAGYEKGEEITVDCWINKTVELDTRD